MAEDNQFDQDDIIEYLENSYFHKDDPDPDDVFEFASESERENADEPTEEMLDRYREYVDKCVDWTLFHMSVDDKFSDILANSTQCAKWADDYDMFTASIRDFLDAKNADSNFSAIKERVIRNRVIFKGLSPAKISDMLILEKMKDMHPQRTSEQSIAATAVIDMLHVQALQEHLNDAIGRGAVVPFDQHVQDKCSQGTVDTNPIMYIPSKSTGYGIIVGDSLIDPTHADIISTYGGLSWDSYPSVLTSVDAYLSWATVGEDEDGNTQWQLDGLCVVPKGSLPVTTQTPEWHASASWPDGVEHPPCPESLYHNL